MTDVSDLVGRIEKAFAWRAVPDHVLEAPLPGDEIEEGQTYGVMPLKENNLTDQIYMDIQGKTWQQVEVPDFVMAIHYISTEAFCYYLPSMLIYNLNNDNLFDTLDGYLRRPTISSLTSSKYNDDYKYEIRDKLTIEEREVVVEYMSYFKDGCELTYEDIAFWNPK